MLIPCEAVVPSCNPKNFSSKKKSVEGKMFWFLVVATIPGVLAGALLDDFAESVSKFDNIIILNVPKLSEIYPQFKEYFFNPLLPTLLIGIYEACVFEKVRPKATFWGLGLGFILLGMCILNSVLLFGPRLAAILDYPYASAVTGTTLTVLRSRRPFLNCTVPSTRA